MSTVQHGTVYSDLPPDSEETIEQIVRIGKCKGDEIEAVNRLDPQTIEIVWYDDVEGDDSPSEITIFTIRTVRDEVRRFFGDHWEVDRKDDQRRRSNKHPQRAIVRRGSHQRFRYRDESNVEYLMALHGRPDGVPMDVERYGDFDAFPEPPDDIDGYEEDVYVWEADTGTVHLLDGDLRGQVVAVDAPCMCSLTLQPETTIDEVVHYAEHLRDVAEPDSGWLPSNDPHPEAVVGDDLCERCRKSYYDKCGSDYEPPSDDFRGLLTWDPTRDDPRS